MIVDDFWQAGLKNFFQGKRPPVFRMPFEVGLRGRRCADGAVEFTVFQDPLVRRLAPCSCASGGLLAVPPDARAPFEWTILVGPSTDQILVVLAQPQATIRGAGDATWFIAALTWMDGAGPVVPAVIHARPDAERIWIYDREPESADEFRDSVGAIDLRDRVSTENFITWSHEAVAQVAVAFSLITARNISTEAVHPDAALSRARERRGKLPLFTYHVLRLTPFAALRDGAHGHPTGERLAIHWVRGHFKTFTEARPLFGRYSGRFWWQPHPAGTDRTRVVVKDYEVAS